jgi:hypothetical protein
MGDYNIDKLNPKTDFECSTDSYTNPFEKYEDGNYFLKRDIKLQCGFKKIIMEELKSVSIYQIYFDNDFKIIRYLIDILIHIFIVNINNTQEQTVKKKLFTDFKNNMEAILSGEFYKFKKPKLDYDPENLVETLTEIIKKLHESGRDRTIFQTFLNRPSSSTTRPSSSSTTRPSSSTAGGKKRRRTQKKHTQRKRTQRKRTQKKHAPKKHTQRKKSRKHLKPFKI